MIVRTVSYGAESVKAVKVWLRDRAVGVDEVVGLERVDFVSQDNPPRAGAIMYFESAEDLRQYRSSERFEWLRESIEQSWEDRSQERREEIYRLIDRIGVGTAEV